MTRPSTQNSRNTQSQSFSAVSAVSALIVVAVWRRGGQPFRAADRAGVRLQPRLGAPPAARRARSPARRLARHRADAQVHQEPACGGRRGRHRAGLGRPDTPLGQRAHGQPDRHDSRRAPPIASSSPAITTRSCFATFRFVGANDGGSSAAFLLEMARVLKARRNALTIELLFLDGEEAFCRNWDDCGRPGAPDNTYGSRHYVMAGKRDGTLAGSRRTCWST